MISSKDDQATASLLGFAIANRVEPNSGNDANGESGNGPSGGGGKGTRSRLQDKDGDQKDTHNNKRGGGEDRGEGNTKGHQSTNEKESGKAATRKSKALARQ